MDSCRIRLTTPTPDFSQRRADNLATIRPLHSDDYATPPRSKRQVYSRQYDDALPFTAQSWDDKQLTTSRRGERLFTYASGGRGQTMWKSSETRPRIHKPSLVSGNLGVNKVQRAIVEVLGRLKDLPGLYAVFKRRDLSVRTILANASNGNNEAALLQVLDFLDQLMTIEAERLGRTKPLNKSTQTPNCSSPTSAVQVSSPYAASSRRSPSISPGRPSFTSCICSPRTNLHTTQFETFTAALRRDPELVDFISPIPSVGTISFVKDNGCRKLLDKGEEMLATIQAQSERIANLNRQIFRARPPIEPFSNQGVPFAPNLTETTSPMSEAVDLREQDSSTMPLFMSELWTELQGSDASIT